MLAWLNIKPSWRALLLVAVLLFSALMIFTNGVDQRYQRGSNFELALLVSAAVYILIEIDALLGCFMLYVSIVSMRTAYSNTALMFALIVFFICVVKMRDSYDRAMIYDCLIVLAYVNLLFQVLQHFHYGYLTYKDDGLLRGFMSNINETSALYAVTAPAFWRKSRWKLTPITIAGLILSHSLQGVVAFAVVAVAAAWPLRQRFFASLQITIIAVCVFVACFMLFVKPCDVKAEKSVRLDVWALSLKVANVKPLIGWGFNQYDKVFPLLTTWKYLSADSKALLLAFIADKPAYYHAVNVISKGKPDYFVGSQQLEHPYDMAHNEFIEFYFIGGAIGIVLGASLLLRALSVGFKAADKTPALGLLSASTVSLFGFSWHLLPLALITVLYLAFIYAEHARRTEMERKMGRLQ